MVEKGQNPKIKIAIVAGEKSGDELGAPLMQSLKSLNPSIEFVGVGGSKMISEGLDSYFDMNFRFLFHAFSIIQVLFEISDRLFL